MWLIFNHLGTAGPTTTTIRSVAGLFTLLFPLSPSKVLADFLTNNYLSNTWVSTTTKETSSEREGYLLRGHWCMVSTREWASQSSPSVEASRSTSIRGPEDRDIPLWPEDWLPPASHLLLLIPSFPVSSSTEAVTWDDWLQQRPAIFTTKIWTSTKSRDASAGGRIRPNRSLGNLQRPFVRSRRIKRNSSRKPSSITSHLTLLPPSSSRSSCSNNILSCSSRRTSRKDPGRSSRPRTLGDTRQGSKATAGRISPWTASWIDSNKRGAGGRGSWLLPRGTSPPREQPPSSGASKESGWLPRRASRRCVA